MTHGSRALCLVVAIGANALCFAQRPAISENAARKLVQDALVALDATKPWVEIMPLKYKWAPEFYTFQTWRPNAGEGPLLTYSFGVNPWTGDVWDLIACKRITSPTLKKEQESISKRSHLSAEKRRVLSEKSPGCSEVELNPPGNR
jgi:hypothetical protein